MNVQPLAGLRSNEDATSRVHDYESFHARRYVYLLAAARRVAPQAPRVLDVGPSPFTAMLEAAYPEVWTLGFHPRPPPPRHIDFDLNGVAHGAKIACERPFDLVIFSEVVEHLHVPAFAALAALREAMSEGGVMILQTPNAAEVMKRVALMRGRNPYETLRLDAYNPGHIREYTMEEMVQAATVAGFCVREAHYADYFPLQVVEGFHPVRAVLDRCRRFVPAFRGGMTLVLAPA